MEKETKVFKPVNEVVSGKRRDKLQDDGETNVSFNEIYTACVLG